MATNHLTTSAAANGSHNGDLFNVKSFHHVEFWCSDAASAAGRFSWALGLPIVAKSDLSTGNLTHASYLLRAGHLSLLFSAPYSPSAAVDGVAGAAIPTFDRESCHAFAASHGLAVRAIALEVADAGAAFRTSVAHGAKPVTAAPVTLGGGATLSEVLLYGDVVLRYISYDDNGRDPLGFLPGFEPVQALISSPAKRAPLDCGIRGVDHALVVVPELAAAVEYVCGFTGFHVIADFKAEEVGTKESGLNQKVMANDEETVYLALCEPVFGTKKSNMETFLEHNEGGGLHHFALVSEDIFRTVREMRERSFMGGFEFVPPPPPTYYNNLKNRAADVLSDEQIQQCEELGILVDRDDQGTLLQIFTKPVGDR